MSTRPGPWLRLTAIAATAGVAGVVATGSWGLAHDVTAHVTLALLAATPAVAAIAVRRSQGPGRVLRSSAP